MVVCCWVASAKRQTRAESRARAPKSGARPSPRRFLPSRALDRQRSSERRKRKKKLGKRKMNRPAKDEMRRPRPAAARRPRACSWCTFLSSSPPSSCLPPVAWWHRPRLLDGAFSRLVAFVFPFLSSFFPFLVVSYHDEPKRRGQSDPPLFVFLLLPLLFQRACSRDDPFFPPARPAPPALHLSLPPPPYGYWYPSWFDKPAALGSYRSAGSTACQPYLKW